jgi:DNA/RNA endonuclease G (NUC1)
MAVKKRATKKAPARKTTRKAATKQSRPRRSRSLPKSQPNEGSFGRILGYVFIIGIVCLLAISAVYYFGSFSTRNQLNRVAINTLNPIRTAQWMPRPIGGAFNSIYDSIPTSEGLIVDAGELGRDERPLLAGIPQTRKPVRVLQNVSYLNLYSERDRQPLCVAIRIAEESVESNATAPPPQPDPRIPNLDSRHLQLNEWTATPLISSAALIHAYGTKGASEAMLLTNLVPLKQDFSDGIWSRIMQELTIDYPARFGEIWVYAGPVYNRERSKLSSGVPIPDALYAIAFDLTDAGGLRAIAFLVPADASSNDSLKDYIVSVSAVEKATGLSFLPELGFDVKDLLLDTVSPTQW